MRLAGSTAIIIVLLSAACSDDGNTKSPASVAPSATGASTNIDLTDACSFLGAADFAGVGFTVSAEGEDVSENFNVGTTSSVACQWISDDDNISSSWELVIGTGSAEEAFETDFSFAQLDTLTTLEVGDEAFLADEVSSFDSAGHDFSAGVRIGDTYFTLSTTDDRGAEAIMALATLVAERLSP